jgi:hypothetical protein
MRTEHDLRDAIHNRADAAPVATPELLRSRPRERGARRRTTLAITAAVAVTAAVTVGTVLLRDGSPHHAPAAIATHHTVKHGPPPTPVSTTPAAEPPPSLLDARLSIAYSGAGAYDALETGPAQYIELRAPGSLTREITAYAPGLFHKSLIGDAQPVTVDGRPGYFGQVLPWRNDNVSHTDPAHTDPRGSKYASGIPMVLWKIGPDQWASVASDVPAEGNPTALEAIAKDVTTTDAPVTTPIRIGYLPPGWKLSDVDHSGPNGLYAADSSLLGFRRNDKYDYWDWDVSYTSPPASAGPGRPITYGEHPIYPQVSRKIGGYTITVETLGAISKAEARKVLDSVTIADQPHAPNDSWFDVADALP